MWIPQFSYQPKGSVRFSLCYSLYWLAHCFLYFQEERNGHVECDFVLSQRGTVFYALMQCVLHLLCEACSLFSLRHSCTVRLLFVAVNLGRINVQLVSTSPVTIVFLGDITQVVLIEFYSKFGHIGDTLGHWDLEKIKIFCNFFP